MGRKSVRNGRYDTSPYVNKQISEAGEELSQLRRMRSPYSKELAMMQEGDASLVYLTREVFKEFLAIEGDLEQTKKELCLRADFTLAGAFNKFSDNTHGRINANDLLFGLEKLGITCDISDAKLIIDRYDADKDCRLGFWEFSNAFLPIQANIRDELERKRAIWDISHETLELLKKTLRKIVDSEVVIESIRQRLSREKMIQLRLAFDTLDWLGRGFITDNEFKRTFEQINERLLQSSTSYQHEILRPQDPIEMEAMIRRFNKDKLNGRISLPEFIDELTSKSSDKVY